MNSKMLIVNGAINRSLILVRKYRDKMTKEIYYYEEKILLTGSSAKPYDFTLSIIST